MSYDILSKVGRAVNFIQALSHTKGEFYKKPFMLLPWQETIIRDLFGVVKEDGMRQFKQAIVYTPKKAGKSELAAAIALYLLCADREQRAEIYGAAADRQMAGLVYSVAADMIRLSPALMKRCKILDSRKRIIYRPTNSFYQVLSSDADRAHGVSAHGVIVDEIHVQKNPDLYNVLTKGSGDARRQPLQFIISTAGDNIHSIGYELFQKAQDLLHDRKADPTIYPVVYAADPEDDWTKPETWRKANPSMGITFPESAIREACESAMQNPSEENVFKTLRLNIWTRQAVRWMPMEKWDACESPVDAERLKGRACYAGLDLSSTQDLTGLVLIFPPEDEEGIFEILPYAWVPEETIDIRSRKDHVNYGLWAKQGYIYNMLMDYPYDVTVKIEGIAASAASVIAMAGTTVLMSPVSCMMIHNPATIAAGDHTEMEKAIAILETVKDSIINAYEIKTGLPREEISRMMEEETWFDANKAVEMGFADGILQRGEISSASDQKSPVLYSQRKANQALVNKLVESAGIPAGPLYKRLNRLKG